MSFLLKVQSLHAEPRLSERVLGDCEARGVRVKPSYTEKINYVPAQYAGGLREKVFDRAGPQAWSDYRKVYPESSK